MLLPAIMAIVSFSAFMELRDALCLACNQVRNGWRMSHRMRCAMAGACHTE